MSAADIAHTLGDARREGCAWRCRCPLHNGRSLTIRDGDGGCVLVTCWGGCDRRDVLTELRRRGLLDGRAIRHPARAARKSNKDDAARTALALGIWREARPAVGTLGEKYLVSRGLGLSPPPTLRFHIGLKHPSG
jgi:putative DNA primase/helicase